MFSPVVCGANLKSAGVSGNGFEGSYEVLNQENTGIVDDGFSLCAGSGGFAVDLQGKSEAAAAGGCRG